MSLFSSLKNKIAAGQSALIRCKTCDESLATFSLREYVEATINPDKTHLVVYPVLNHLVNYPDHVVVGLCMGIERNLGKEYVGAVEKAARSKGLPLDEVLKDMIRELEQKY